MWCKVSAKFTPVTCMCCGLATHSGGGGGGGVLSVTVKPLNYEHQRTRNSVCIMEAEFI